ncbi:glycosyl hydrolase family 47-domain-containing protein [Schizothecium vesticola]|uniref:alpha-1,2-Mannosidase n=1 Tax=Schizothecium vesticola TaxID=314040 RepID=A0AA40F2H7_9PEZI|nr:glycosyl hydrolase family 47-domain-containing protein [Schizothecium vesticola]
MPRFRRIRVYLVFAIFALALLYHVSRNSTWNGADSTGFGRVVSHNPLAAKPKPDDKKASTNIRPPNEPAEKPATETAPLPGPPTAAAPDVVNPVPEVNIPKLKTSHHVQGAYGLPTKRPGPPTPAIANTLPTPATEDTLPTPATDDTPSTPTPDSDADTNGLDGTVRYADLATAPATPTSPVHWTKPHEFYPVPSASLLRLPTGTPKTLRAVQYAFPDPEAPAAREKRLRRQAKVKAEAGRAWEAYRHYAWTHDEVKPVSLAPNDPFCGWAATLVDALDTLWLMNMTAEFDAGVEVVKAIDFTTTPYRVDIPVFETIIRYLGGLLGAYDVTGGHDGRYRVLLDKAVELAEILMSVFDTPNRMPVLYYQWKPEYNISPKKASTSSGVAELGSMGMEFTRLAQLTGEDKYYDAIARITDALEELQNRPGGTALPGIFPQNLDASGCNRTAAAERREEALRKQTEEDQRKNAEDEARQAAAAAAPDRWADDADEHVLRDNHTRTDVPGLKTKRGSRSPSYPYYGGSSLDDEDECIPQPLVGSGFGQDSYSMGGSQDSAYEYFPKLYALLGGLVPKYQAMHVKTVDAVRKYLLFRPMAAGDPDVLFSAKALSSNGNDAHLSYEYEVTHLTCFLGGMFALGGKLFDRPADVNIGGRLAEGCVWAYDVFPTGIMPEYAQVLPCPDAADCHFDEAAWHEKLDPNREYRERRMQEYHLELADWEKEVEEIKAKDAEEKRRARAQAEKAEAARLRKDEEARGLRPVNNTRTGDLEGRPIGHDHEEETHVHRRDDSGSDPLDFNSAPAPAPVPATTTTNTETETETQQRDAGGDQKPILYIPPKPTKPLTHAEYIAEQLNITHVPRASPEAIESVWYMYRITGDPVWQERGWRMFEAVIRATRAEGGHSAIYDVTTTDRHPGGADSMESFWLAETLKYFWLLFAEPDVVSLDKWVLNTEAHPFRRPG